MELNKYQERAMSTCMDSSNNFVYAVNGLTAEVGEVNDKVAKWVRKGYVSIEENELRFSGNLSNEEIQHLIEELCKECGDCLWFVALLSRVLGKELEEIAQQNLDKLASRKERNVIDGNGDNR